MTGLTLLSVGQEDNQDDPTPKFKGVARIRGPRWAHLPTMTIGLLVVSIFWSVEMSYASPYLLSLGLSKSSMAGVFVAGPLSGLIMQPLIGTLTDNSTSRFGRRRPYMLLGTLICMVSMLLLGFTRPIASLFTGLHSTSNDNLTISLAVLSIFLIDFSINAVTAVDRALLVDTLPSSSQASGNAWAATMMGVGGVVGFFIGNINLPRILPLLGKTQLEILSIVASLLLLIGHLVMAMLVDEPVLCSKSQGKSFRQEIKDIWSNTRTLPRVIRQICVIQFFGAMAFFPYLFYTTIYIGDLYKRGSPIPTTNEERLSLDAEAQRLGSYALFLASALSLLINIILPAFVSGTSIRSIPTVPNSERSWLDSVCSVPKCLQIDLATIWAVGHFVFAACMFATFFTQDISGSMVLITVTGFSSAVGQWAPFSLLGEAILTEQVPQSESAICLLDRLPPRLRTVEDQERDFLVSGRDSDEEDDDEYEGTELQEKTTHSGAQFGSELTEVNEDDGDEVRQSGDSMRPRVASGIRGRQKGTLASKAGIVLGIHNIFIVTPQFLVTALAAFLFAIVDPVKPELPGHRAPVLTPHPGPATNLNVTTLGLSKNITDSIIEMSVVRRVEVEDASHLNSVVYLFCFGGIASSFAFVLTWRLARELRRR